MLRSAVQFFFKNPTHPSDIKPTPPEEKKSFSQRLAVINSDQQYPLAHLEPLCIFEDDITFELMNHPRVITKGGYKVDVSTIDQQKDNQQHVFYEGEKLIILPDNFDSKTKQERADELELKVSCYPEHMNKEEWLQDYRVLLDELYVFKLQTELQHQYEEYVANQEAVYASWKAVNNYLSQINTDLANLIEDISEDIGPKKMEMLILEHFDTSHALLPLKKKLRQDLEKFIQDTTMLILTSPFLTHYERTDECNPELTRKEANSLQEVLARPIEMLKELEQEINALNIENQRGYYSQILSRLKIKEHGKVFPFETAKALPFQFFRLDALRPHENELEHAPPSPRFGVGSLS